MKIQPVVRQRRKEIRDEAKRILLGKVLFHPYFPHDIYINVSGIKEWLNQPHKHYAEKNEALLQLPELLLSSVLKQGFARVYRTSLCPGYNQFWTFFFFFLIFSCIIPKISLSLQHRSVSPAMGGGRSYIWERRFRTSVVVEHELRNFLTYSRQMTTKRHVVRIYIHY